MKYTIATEHRNHFETHRNIEFEGLLSIEKLQQLNQAIESVTTTPISPHRARWDKNGNPEDLFAHGRDLWRKSPVVKRYVTGSAWAHIAAELLGKRPVRIGYDQLLPTHCTTLPSSLEEENLNLETISSLQGVTCGMILCLKASSSTLTGFPTIPGSALYFYPDFPIDFTALKEASHGGLFLLVVYTGKTAIYLKRKEDPHVNALKSIGYCFGDRLKDDLHPILVR